MSAPTPGQIEAAFQAEWQNDLLPQIKQQVPGRIVAQHYGDIQSGADYVWQKAVAWALAQVQDQPEPPTQPDQP